MRQIFLAPRSNETAYKNYLSSMQGRPKSELLAYLTLSEQEILKDSDSIHAWGCQPSLENRWQSMNIGDYVMFYTKGKFVSVGRLIFKKKDSDLALALWPRNKETNEPWSCVFFVDDIIEIDLSLEEFNELTGYSLTAVMGFMPVKTGLEKIEAAFGSTDAFMETLRSGFTVDEVNELSGLSKGSMSDSLEDLARLDEITREKDDESIELALQRHAANSLNKSPEQITKLVKQYKRNRKLVRDIKAKYNNKCQICGFTFKMANGNFYSEAAHIVPVSSGKAGVDSPDNIWVLCANHHKMLDTKAILAVGNRQYIEDGIIKDLATV